MTDAVRRRPEGPVAVAISTAGRPRELERCLESLAAGTRRPTTVVVVDQAQDAETADVVERSRAGGLDAVYVPQERLGLGAGQNAAVAAAGAELVAVLDDDCVADARWLETVGAVLAAEGGPDVVTGPVLPLPVDGVRRVAVSSRTSRTARLFTAPTAPWHVGSGNNFAFRRAAFEEIGGCDERLGPGSPGRGGVDMDLFYRLLRAGFVIRYEPAAVVHHSRATPADRRARRVPYGHGMGVCTTLWLRDGDVRALRILAEWLAFRLVRLLRAAAALRWSAAQEEALVLGGTIVGVAHGLRV